MFMEYAQKYHDKIQFAHCDFDTEAGLNAKFRVRHIPTLLLIRKGEILDTLVEPKKVGSLRRVRPEGFERNLISILLA